MPTGKYYSILLYYKMHVQNKLEKNIKIRTFTKVLIILKTKINSVICTKTKTKTKIFLDKLINIVIHQSIITLILITYYFLGNLEYS